jgi:hypothetical protein
MLQFKASDKPLLVFIRTDNGAVLGTDIPFGSKIPHRVGYGIRVDGGWLEVERVDAEAEQN